MLNGIRWMLNHSLCQVDVEISHLNINMLRNNLHTIQQLHHLLLHLQARVSSNCGIFSTDFCSHSWCSSSYPWASSISNLIGILGNHSINFSKSLCCLLVDFMSNLFLYIFLLLKCFPIGGDKIFLRLLDLLKLPFNDRVGHIIISAFPHHALHIERVNHIPPVLWLLHFLYGLILNFFLCRLGHLLQKSSIVYVF